MAVIPALSATTSATPSTQSLLNQSQLTQARQAAQQERNNAREFRGKADHAENLATQWQRKAQSLSAELLQQAQDTLAAAPAYHVQPPLPPAPTSHYITSGKPYVIGSTVNAQA